MCIRTSNNLNAELKWQTSDNNPQQQQVANAAPSELSICTKIMSYKCATTVATAAPVSVAPQY